jgi:hypothetical protein
LTKLINENKTDWDEYLSTMLFSYKFAYKATTRYMPYQLVYGLRPLMPIEYIVLIASGNERDNTLMRVLTNRITELEKLQKTRMQAIDITRIQQWNRALWNQQKNPEKQFNFDDYVLWFPKCNESHLGKFIRKWFGLYKI